MKGKGRLIVTLTALLLFCFMSVGYATYGAHTSVLGEAKFLKNGDVYIESAVLSDNKNLVNPYRYRLSPPIPTIKVNIPAYILITK